MNTKMKLGGFLLIALTTLIGLHFQPVVAEEPAPAVIQAIENGQMEALFAEATQEGGYNLNAIYDELKDLGKQYKRASTRAENEQAKGRIVTRVEELMGQLFDAKVQKEQQRIEVQQRRLDEDKRKFATMQDHKWDLVKEGVQKALNGEPLPEWALRTR